MSTTAVGSFCPMQVGVEYTDRESLLNDRTFNVVNHDIKIEGHSGHAIYSDSVFAVSKGVSYTDANGQHISGKYRVTRYLIDSLVNPLNVERDLTTSQMIALNITSKSEPYSENPHLKGYKFSFYNAGNSYKVTVSKG